MFYGLNAVRALSVVSLLLAFASSVVVIVSDVRAVNKSQHDPNFNQGACGYVGCDSHYPLFTLCTVTLTRAVMTFRGSTVPDQPAGVFWAVVNRLFIIFQLVFLILSEISWPMAFFDRFFPVLGSDFGLGALGIFQGLYVLTHPFFFLETEDHVASARRSSRTTSARSRSSAPSSSSPWDA